VNHWVVALKVTLATFMEVLDTSIANATLPHIAGSLSAGRSQSTWVLTSYMVANAIVLPISGWLIGIFGRKRQSRLVEHVRPANPWVDQMIEHLTQLRIVRGGVSSVVGHEQALALLSRMVREQARVNAYVDIFWLFGGMILATIPLVFFMKRSVARGELAAH
jgi:MFS family permease